jgi:hypothetical protein
VDRAARQYVKRNRGTEWYHERAPGDQESIRTRAAPVPRTGNEVSMDSLEKSLDWLFSEEPQEGIKCLDVSGEPGRTRTCNPLISADPT